MPRAQPGQAAAAEARAGGVSLPQLLPQNGEGAGGWGRSEQRHAGRQQRSQGRR
jgi:hypothetical protein